MAMKALSALVVATHPEQCRTLVHSFERLGLKLSLAFTVSDARRALESTEISLVCCAPEFHDGTYHEVVQAARQRRLPVVLLLRQSDWREYVDAMEHGVFDCLSFPCSHNEVERIVQNALAPRRLPARRAVSA